MSDAQQRAAGVIAGVAIGRDAFGSSVLDRYPSAYGARAVAAALAERGLLVDDDTARLISDVMRVGREIVKRRNGRTEYALAGFIDELAVILDRFEAREETT